MRGSSPAPTSVLLVEGQNAYISKKYELAIQLFTKALDTSALEAKADTLHILDLRIGAYVKLRRHDLAQADAKSMIRIARNDIRGYVRCGQLDRLNGDYEAALRWYRYGLKEVSPTHEMFPYLEAQLLKTKELIASKIIISKPTDPITALPIEILQMILTYLDYPQHVALLSISRGWNRLLRCIPPVSDTLDFRNAKRQINHTMLAASLKRLSKYPKNILLTNLTGPAASSIRQHLARWVNFQSLERLEVDDSKISVVGLRFEKFNLRKIVMGPRTSIVLSQIHTILKTCKSISTAKFANVVDDQPFLWANDFDHYAMETLEISNENTNLIAFPIDATSTRDQASGLEVVSSSGPIFGRFQSLQRLVCRGARIARAATGVLQELDFSAQTHLQQIDLSASILPGCVKFPPTLEVLKLNKVRFEWSASLADSPKLLPNLAVLDIYNSCPDMRLLRQIRDRDGHGVLRELSIDLDFNESMAPLFIDLVLHHGWLAKLQTLRIKSQDLEDSHSQMFVQCMPELQKLTLEYAKISGVFLVELLTPKCCKLRELVLRDCSKVSLDSVEWARERGVGVTTRSVANMRLGGRAIRTIA